MHFSCPCSLVLLYIIGKAAAVSYAPFSSACINISCIAKTFTTALQLLYRSGIYDLRVLVLSNFLYCLNPVRTTNNFRVEGTFKWPHRSNKSFVWHPRHMLNKWELEEWGFLIGFGHAEALLLKKKGQNR